MHAATAFLDRTKAEVEPTDLLTPPILASQTGDRTCDHFVLLCHRPASDARSRASRGRIPQVSRPRRSTRMPATICYAVTVADVNGDQKPDVVAVTEDAVVWYENPSWRKADIIRKATARDNVCIQPHDVDGDGRVDFALGAGWRAARHQEPQHAPVARPRRRRPLADPPDPVRGADAAPPPLGRREGRRARNNSSSRPCRAAAPRARTGGQGRGSASSSTTFPRNPTIEPWPVEIADSSLHTIHNLQLVDLDGDRRDEIVVAAWEGVFVLDRDPAGHWTKTRIGTGNQDSTPSKGSSEVKVGRLARRACPMSPRSSPGTVIRSSSTHPRTGSGRRGTAGPSQALVAPGDRRAAAMGSRRLVRRSRRRRR